MPAKLKSLIRNLARKRERDEELDAEVRGYADMLAEEKMREGVQPEEARRAARIELGGLEQVKERVRDARAGAWFDSFLQDVRYGARVLRKSPGFTIVAVLTLALGIGANTAIFSVLDAVLLRPLPYKNADRLTVIWQSDAAHMATGGWFDAYGEFEEWDRNSRSFEEMAAFSWANAGATLSRNGERERILAIPVSLKFFSILGIPPEQGRTFEAQDLGDVCSAVVSHGFWKKRLGGSPGIIGSALNVDDKPCVVRGVMPSDFSFYPKQTQLWTLITPADDYVRDPWHSMVGVLGLLKPGRTRSGAQDEISALQARVQPESSTLAAMHLQPDVLDLQREFTWLTGRNFRVTVVVLFASVILVLLIACLNVGSLLLGRASQRQREFGVRFALGASRVRVIRLLLTECALLAGTGAVIGTILAAACLRYLNSADATDLPPGNPIGVSWRVFVFAAAIAGVAVVIFGLSPAWRASNVDLNTRLRAFAQGSSSIIPTRGASKITVAVEVAISLVLVTAAALLTTSLTRLISTPLGFQPEHLLTAHFDLPEKSYPKDENLIRFSDRVQSAVGRLPGVEGVAISPEVGWEAGPLTVYGEPSTSGGNNVHEQVVSPAYFRVLQIPILRGRGFDERDRESSEPVAVINEVLARRFFRDVNPLGRAIKLSGDKEPWLTIVGVSGDVKSTTVFKEMGYEVERRVYRPLRQKPLRSGAVFVRTSLDSGTAAREVRDAVAGIDTNLPPPDVQTMRQWLAQFFTQPRFRAGLLGIFAALALFLAAVGIYGVISQSVAQRTHEIGIRMAVGAQRRDVLGMIFREGTGVVFAGIGAGIVGAIMLTRLLRTLLYDVQPADPATLAIVSIILIGVAALACLIPARRAMRVDPMVALRHQ